MMRLITLAPFFFLTIPSISASLATDAFTFANGLVSSDPEAKKGEMHTMDSWTWIDCGEYKSSSVFQTRG